MSLNSNDPFEAYKVYIACKLHFESKSYDFFKYNGKTSVTPKSFFARRDKFFFAKLAKRYGLAELKYFYASNFAHHGTKWVGDLNEDRADETYKAFKAMQDSFTYRFKTCIDTIIATNDFKSLFAVDDGQYPLLVNMLLREEIPLEIFTVLNRYIGFMSKFDKEIKDPIMWPDLSLKIKKYNPFISVNSNIKDVLKDCLQSNATVV